MALNKVTYVDNVTVIGATNLNAIQDEIIANGTNIGTLTSGKVDKVTGKGLSTNDFTTEMLTKLNGIETGATNVTVDSTLSVTGNAADAKAAGDAIFSLERVTDNLGAIDIDSLGWARGRISANDGSPAVSNYDIRCDFFPVGTHKSLSVIFNFPEIDGVDYYQLNVYEYSQNSASTFISSVILTTEEKTRTLTLNPSTGYLRLAFRAFPLNTTVIPIDGYKNAYLMWGDGIIQEKDDILYENLQTEKHKLQTENYNSFHNVTVTEQGIATFDDGADDIPVKSLVVHIMPVLGGQGDPSPENIRGISGWDSVNISKSGKNLFTTTWQQGTIASSGGNSSSDTIIRTAGYLRVAPGVHYTLKRTVTGGQISFRVYNKQKVFMAAGSSDKAQLTIISGKSNAYPMGENYQKCTFMFGEDVGYFRIIDQTNDLSTVYTMVVGDEPLEPTATTQAETFKTESLTIPFGNDIGTVYGGTLDVTSGILNVDWAIYTATGDSLQEFNTSSLDKVYVRTSGAGVGNIPKTPGGSQPYEHMISNQYNTFINSGAYDINIRYLSGSPSGFCIYDTRFTSLEQAKGLLDENPVQIAYELRDADKKTYQLTPQELKTFLGDNNIFADTGNVDVVYRADPSIHESNQKVTLLSMFAPTEDGATASQAYAQGKYFIRNNQFCKALTSIASGAAFTLDTNYAVTNLADELFSALS